MSHTTGLAAWCGDAHSRHQRRDAKKASPLSGFTEAIFAAGRLSACASSATKADLLFDGDQRKHRTRPGVGQPARPEHHHPGRCRLSAIPAEIADPPSVCTSAAILTCCTDAESPWSAAAMPRRRGIPDCREPPGILPPRACALSAASPRHRCSRPPWRSPPKGETVAVIGPAPTAFIRRATRPGHRDCRTRRHRFGVSLGTPAVAYNFPRVTASFPAWRAAFWWWRRPRSGSLITARLAAEQGREYSPFPDRFTFASRPRLSQTDQRGAKLVETAQDILEELGNFADPDARCRPLLRRMNRRYWPPRPRSLQPRRSRRNRARAPTSCCRNC